MATCEGVRLACPPACCPYSRRSCQGSDLSHGRAQICLMAQNYNYLRKKASK